MADSSNSIRDKVECGLDTIAPELTVEVNVQDLLFIQKSLAEAVSFFHNPRNMRTLGAVQEFLGDGENDKKDGFLAVLSEAYYKRSRNMLPVDIERRLQDGEFDA